MSRPWNLRVEHGYNQLTRVGRIYNNLLGLIEKYVPWSETVEEHAVVESTGTGQLETEVSREESQRDALSEEESEMAEFRPERRVTDIHEKPLGITV